MRRTYVTLEPTSPGEMLGLAGWALGPRGDALVSPRGDTVFFREEPDGRVSFWYNDDGTDARDLLERVPSEELDDEDA